MGKKLFTDDGNEVKILSPGVHNKDAGPDFSVARILIGDNEWCGNVEIHVKASDWYRHRHDSDPAYDSVILHLVGISDTRVTRSDGSVIPQVEAVLPQSFYYTYSMLHSGLSGVRCSGMLREIPSVIREDWLEALSVERVYQKCRRILEYREFASGDFEQAVFIALARALGFGLNGEPFEILARSIPLKYIYRHGDSPLQIEAMLFGQAGMLDPQQYPYDEYYQTLCREYQFLRRKYDLYPIQRQMWKFSRTRPGNFPYRRISMLAGLLSKGGRISASLLETDCDYDKLKKLLSLEAGGYWSKHGCFGENDTDIPSGLSASSVESLMINLAVPGFYAYSVITGDPLPAERAINLMSKIRSERNSIISAWNAAGIQCGNALRSQALLQLRKEYCDKGRCKDCRFGYYFMRRDLIPTPVGMLSVHITPPEHEVRRGVLIAIDSFKGCLSSREAGEAIARGIISRNPDILPSDVEVVAVADGGEGMADAIGDSRNLERFEVTTVDPCMRAIKAGYRYDMNISTAFMDIASASGFQLLNKNERNPMCTTTFGTGLMIKDAVTRGAKLIVLGLGGSATNDAAIGCMQALGAKFRLRGEKGWHRQPLVGADLIDIEEMDLTESDKLLENVRIVLACDVNNVFCGAMGATQIFASQKGANPKEVRALEKGMKKFADLLRESSGKNIALLAGAGAAGGAAGGLTAMAGAEIYSGADIVLRGIGFTQKLKGKSLVITGEGCADLQTLHGKLPGVIRRYGTRKGIPVIMVAGRVENEEELRNFGFTDVIDINTGYPTTEHGGENPLDPEVARKRLMDVGRLRITGVRK